MIVQQLIDRLNKVENKDRLVVMSKDSEGNGFSPLYDFGEEAYAAETTWYGYVGLEKLTEEDRKKGFSEEDVIEDGVPALVLWPTN